MVKDNGSERQALIQLVKLLSEYDRRLKNLELLTKPKGPPWLLVIDGKKGNG